MVYAFFLQAAHNDLCTRQLHDFGPADAETLNAGFSGEKETRNITGRSPAGQAKYPFKQQDTNVCITPVQPGRASLPTPCVLLRCRQLRKLGFCPSAPAHKKGIPLATYKELADFLAEVERRAFKQTVFSVRDEHLALDIVQEAMLKLSEKYSDRPITELPMLFQRILQNATRDFFRRQKVRSAWVTPLSTLFGADPDEDYDPLDTLEIDNNSKVANRPADQLEQKQVLDIIEKAIATLPLRQRQAFMLRYWEELDVAEAAKAMGCSEGSVKTHCSRATHALAALLRKQGIEL